MHRAGCGSYFAVIAKNGDRVHTEGGSAAYTTNKKGDVDRNGSCTTGDMLKVRNAILIVGGKIGLDYHWGLDVNDTRGVTTADLIFVRNVILGL